ncbi:ABC transporter substrate-binding protein [Paenibacillus glucanolyticus]|uniref:ABC transporter substrate-binding protein n=1 Tax=Paenibacillus glucanolyticus TaxID=59843 RepID=A0A163F6C3_9BACL|nr:MULTISPECIES: ABC transporter substrate-binding protein [Paenibacillus]KZS44185.1 ABC transporter substrate-binding protein [Paenibacillus glucanolyticus]MDH6670004.1 putative aldouronate transport system substrate-binding protein [Paenibacillus sp. LBL]
MKKKVNVFISFIVITALLLTGCSGAGDDHNESAESPGDASGKKVKLTALITKHPLTKPLAEMEWLQKVEEAAGVEIEWQEITADWGQKKGTMLASGDTPDLFIGPNVITDADFAQFQGLFQDLSSMLDQAPNVQTMFNEKPDTKVIATQSDGKIYGLPKYQRFWPASASRQFINQQWLDNLGLGMPTTWDELYEVLVAFKEKDANGNGNPNDEIPMDWPGGIGGYFNPAVLLGSMGITLTDGSGQGYFVEDGQVKNFLTDDRYKTMVLFLNKLYKAGLINPEVFTHDYTKYQSIARGEGDTAKVGFTWGWVASDRFGEQLAPQYASMPQLKASADYNGKLSWSYDYYSLNYGPNHIVMSAKTKNKEAAMRFINELYAPEVGMQVLFGSIGPNIKDNGDGTYAVLPPADAKMDPGTWKWTSTMADNGAFYIPDSLKLTLGTDMQEVLGQSEPLEPALEVDPDKDVFPGMFIKYSTIDNNTMSLNNTNVMNLAESSFAKWVTKGGVEAEWDSYIKESQKAGLKQNLEIMQKYYDDYMNQN